MSDQPASGPYGWTPIFAKQHSRFIIMIEAMVFPLQRDAIDAGMQLATSRAGELLGISFTGEALLLVDGAVQYAEAELPIPVGVLSGPGVDASFRFSES